MKIKNIKWYLQTARSISKGRIRTFIKIIFQFVKNRKIFEHLLNENSSNSVYQIVHDRPRIFGVLIWPFICCSWDSDTKLERLINHYHTIDQIPVPIQFRVNQKALLIDGSQYFGGLEIVLDQPKWFMREGLLALSLFVDDLRIYTIAFTLYTNPDKSVDAYIGAIQGRNIDSINDLYKKLTKKLYGVRPRDFIIEIFRQLCTQLDVSKILSVNNASRIAHHQYYRFHEPVKADYNKIWLERGGELIDDDFYSVPIKGNEKERSNIPSKKRAMYKKRHKMFCTLRAELISNICNLKPIKFVEYPSNSYTPGTNAPGRAVPYTERAIKHI